MMINKLSIVVLVSAFLGSTAYAASASSVVSIQSVVGTENSHTGSSVLNKAIEPADISLDKRYNTDEIENQIQKATTDMSIAVNSVKKMAFLKANPVRSSIENYDIGTPKDLIDMLKALTITLDADFDLLSEKDEKAIGMIPIGESGFTMPNNIKISVMGGSNIQGHPLIVNGKIIGHFRTICGGFRTDDVLINQKSSSYCVASVLATGVSRTSDVHTQATTKLFYMGVTKAFTLGEKAEVEINWYSNPKSGSTNIMTMYNLHNIPKAIASMDYNTNLILGDGTVLAGANARITQ